MWIKFVAALSLVIMPLAPASSQELRPQPEAGTGSQDRGLTTAKQSMVVAAHPLASDAGRNVLRRGGSAIDAAIAVQLVLGLVEPQSSGLGGGAFIVHFHAQSRTTTAIDGRETAPAAANADRFLRDGKPMPFREAVRSGLSVGVPGVVRALGDAHKAHGKLPWRDLFEPAIELAEGGFPVSRRLALLLAWQGPAHFAPAARQYFFDEDGRPRAEGTTLKNPEYAATLRTLADQGADGFYSGSIADAIVAAVAAAPIAAGDLTARDLASYKSIVRDPLCFAYRQRTICGMGPPSSGTIAIGQTLKVIEPFTQVQGPHARLSTRALHIIVEAQKLAFADRNRYVADPAFVSVPSGLLDDTYLATRRALIDPAASMAKAQPGVPPGLGDRAFGIDATVESAGTSHFSIVDGQGNAVAMTTTIESAFGSGLWAAGFLLNNELTDFSFSPVDRAGATIANAVAAGKRPRSSMAPLIVFNARGDVEIVTGSPGGSRIILFVTKTLVALLDWGMDAQQAAALANFGSEGGPVTLEFDGDTIWPALGLKGLGHKVRTDLMTSGTHTIVVRDDRLEAGVDPRREGAARGD